MKALIDQWFNESTMKLFSVIFANYAGLKSICLFIIDQLEIYAAIDYAVNFANYFWSSPDYRGNFLRPWLQYLIS